MARQPREPTVSLLSKGVVAGKAPAVNTTKRIRAHGEVRGEYENRPDRPDLIGSGADFSEKHDPCLVFQDARQCWTGEIPHNRSCKPYPVMSRVFLSEGYSRLVDAHWRQLDGQSVVRSRKMSRLEFRNTGSCRSVWPRPDIIGLVSSGVRASDCLPSSRQEPIP